MHPFQTQTSGAFVEFAMEKACAQTTDGPLRTRQILLKIKRRETRDLFKAQRQRQLDDMTIPDAPEEEEKEEEMIACTAQEAASILVLPSPSDLIFLGLIL